MRTSRVAQAAVIAGLLLVWCMSASAQDIKYNFMQGTDFSKYKTYKWVQVPNAQYPNSILDDQIKRAIDTQLAAKGLSKTEENPDLYVTYQVAVNQEKQWNSYSTGGGYFLRSFAIALFMFFSTFAGSLPEPSVLLAAPRQTCFFVPTSYMSRFSVPILIV